VLVQLHAALGSIGTEVAPYGKGDAAQEIVQRLCADLA
jgi:hypothetical protein